MLFSPTPHNIGLKGTSPFSSQMVERSDKRTPILKIGAVSTPLSFTFDRVGGG